MGLRDFWQRMFPGRRERYYTNLLMGQAPIFSSFGENVLVSDIVQNALHAVAAESSKAILKSVVQNPATRQVMVENDEITRLFRYRPNPLMTTQSFLYRVAYLRKLNKNVFIYPQMEHVAENGRTKERFAAFWPLDPIGAEFLQDDAGALFLRLTFTDGGMYTFPYQDIIHLRDNFAQNPFFGGGADGTPDERELAKTLGAIDVAMQGLPKAISASLQIKGVYHAKSVLDAKRIAEEREKFESQIGKSFNGIVATDYAGEFTPVTVNPSMIPRDILDWLENKVLKTFGVSMAVVNGDFTEAQFSAFHQKSIEDFFIELEQAFTARCFTQREQDIGHRLKVYDRYVQHLSMETRLKMIELGAPMGTFGKDEIRELMGYEPRGDDTVMQSLNWIATDLAGQYQLANSQKPLRSREGGEKTETTE